MYGQTYIMHEYVLHYIMFIEYMIIYQSGALRNFYREKISNQTYAYNVCSLLTVCAYFTSRLAEKSALLNT